MPTCRGSTAGKSGPGVEVADAQVGVCRHERGLTGTRVDCDLDAGHRFILRQDHQESEPVSQNGTEQINKGTQTRSRDDDVRSTGHD